VQDVHGMRGDDGTPGTVPSSPLDGALEPGAAGAVVAASRWPGVARYVAARVGQGVLILFGALTVSFILIHLTGNPATVLAGGQLPPAQVQALSHQLGYDRPLGVQYVTYLENAVQGNFGTSFRYGTSALSAVLSALPNTLVLIGISLTAAVAISVAVASASVLRQRGWSDRLWRPLLSALQGIPDFWIALVLVLVLAVHLHWLPSLGYTGFSSLIMPCVALTLPMLASFTRLLRASMLDFTGSDVALALRARGLSRREIVLHHAMRNAMVVFVSYVALQAGWLVGSTVIVETIFAWPGIGTMLIGAVQARDLAIVQATVVIVAVAFTLLNLAADLAVIWLDPRIGRER
jgi:ABC-type dipeptide/oligopeptide/nickel transport system permease component